MHAQFNLPIQGQPFPAPPEFNPSNYRVRRSSADSLLQSLRPMRGHELPGGHVITSYPEDDRHRYEVVYENGDYISGLNSGQASRLVGVLHEIEFGF